MTEPPKLDNTVKMKPTVEWMEKYYAIANEWLFKGLLGDCDFRVEPISNSNWLGSFRLNVVPGTVYVNKSNRRMFIKSPHGNIWIVKENFVRHCRPVITLSSQYSATELALFSTLVHEMCHYYTYMYGWSPRQAHGREFKDAGYWVSRASGNLFSIQRLVDAELGQTYEADTDLQAKKDRRKELALLRATYYLVFRKNGQVRLINTNSSSIVDNVIAVEKYEQNKIGMSVIIRLTNRELTEKIYNEGYKTQSRTYRFWGFADETSIIKDILSTLSNYEIVWGDETILSQFK